MQVRRSRAVVDWFKFEKRNAVNEELPETKLNTDVVLLSTKEENQTKLSTVGVQLAFCLVLERLIVTGKMSQINYIVGKEIESEADFSQEEVHELLAPLFDIIQRLSYEITEIVFDEPGEAVDFSPVKKE